MKAKKIFTYAFVALMCLALVVGCSPKAPAPDATKAADVIKIGGNFELTGGVAEFGKKGEMGAKLAIKEANAKGGILGKKIEYVGADNKSEASESTLATTKLVTQDKVVGIIGPMTSTNTLAAVQVLNDNKVPLITPTGTNATVTVKADGTLNKWMFRACFIDPFQGEVAANFAIDQLKSTKASIIIDQKSDYAKGLAASFKETFEKAGKQVISTEQYVAGQDKDFRSILTNIKAKNPDVIFVPGYYGEVGLIVKQARDLGMKMAMLGGDGWGDDKLLDIAGKDSLNNTFYVDHVASDDPALAAFAASFKAEYNQDINSFAVLGYDAAKMMIAAIEKAGSTDTAKIQAALETMSGFKGVSGESTIDPKTHNPKKSASIIKFVDGKKVFAARVNPK
ncbi:MAG: ABC transporter substrate-binding protein [Peptococcaceae bacterium]|nr:ABC transporter substrate-binding protein [Peptococcaceae bacterium]